EQMPEQAASDRVHSQTRLLVQRLLELRDVERNEIASELKHDVYRDLTAVSNGLHGMLTDAAGGGTIAQPLAIVAALADTALNGLRRVLFDLNPPGVLDLGFAAALERYVAEQSARSGVGIMLTQPQEPLLARQELLAVVYAVVREGITNAVEHSQASQIEVTVAAGPDALRVRVSDNGVGIRDADRQRPGCFGLLAATERIQQLGGSLRVLGIVGSGTHFEISVPTGR
ncbi:MAG TPA: ATP-binding protein, partial [Casimicrobiaceae bacterium]